MKVSIPTEKIRPVEDTYGMEVLTLFDRLTRATYLTKYGEQAPPYDPKKRIKRWFDSSVEGDGEVSYDTFLVQAGRAIPTKVVLSKEDARTVNLPGLFSYLKYNLAPSRAWVPVYDPTGTTVLTRNAYPPEELATYAEAEALKLEFAAAGFPGMEVEHNQMAGPFAVMYEPEEIRRVLILRFGDGTGGAVSVQRSLITKSKAGVGAPGRWVKLPFVSFPVWVSEISTDVGETDQRPEIQIPMRVLKQDEEFVPAFAGQVHVRRKDSIGHITDEMPVLVARIERMVRGLAVMAGVSTE